MAIGGVKGLAVDYVIEEGEANSGSETGKTMWRKWASGKLEVWQTDWWTFSSGYTIVKLSTDAPKFVDINVGTYPYKSPLIFTSTNYRDGYNTAGITTTPASMVQESNGLQRFVVYARIGSSQANGKHWINAYIIGYWK